MSIWKPEQTAPRDGTVVLLFSPDSVEPKIFLGWWSKWEFEGGTPPEFKDDPAEGWIDAWTDREIDTWPTHWMPLPDCPA